MSSGNQKPFFRFFISTPPSGNAVFVSQSKRFKTQDFLAKIKTDNIPFKIIKTPRAVLRSFSAIRYRFNDDFKYFPQYSKYISKNCKCIELNSKIFSATLVEIITIFSRWTSCFTGIASFTFGFSFEGKQQPRCHGKTPTIRHFFFLSPDRSTPRVYHCINVSILEM